jgi:hypothetical protein
MRVFTILTTIILLSVTKIEAKVYGLIIGVDNYTNAQNLKYAKDDAILFYTTVKSINPSLDAEWNVLLDDDATPEIILAHFFRYIELIKEEDTFIFYYAGHGFKDGIYVSDGYRKSGVYPFDLLKTGIKYILAKNKLIFMDACQSAGIVNSELNTYVNDTFKKSSDTRKKIKGQNIMLFLGAGVRENSLESGTLGHGLFTFFLCYGLQGEADFNKDKLVQIDELFYFFRNNTFIASKIISSKYQCPLLIGNFDKKLIIANLNL